MSASESASASVSESAFSRRDLELSLRAAHLALHELREDLHALAAQVVALTERTATLAASDDPARFESEVDERTAALRSELALSDAGADGRLQLAAPEDKYTLVAEEGPPCAELLPICGARCCTFEVALSSQDLDEGGLRWDYARPYLLARRADGQCVHHDTTGCTVYERRPATCRRYDCRRDGRVWLDYERRVLAPTPSATAARPSREQLEQRARDRALATFVEATRLRRR